jgi:integrase
MRFSELLKEYEDNPMEELSEGTKRTYRNSLKALTTYFVEDGGDPYADEITKGDVTSFLEWRKRHSPDGETCAPLGFRALRKDHSTLSAIFKYGFAKDVVRENPVQKTKRPKGDKREPLILDADQYEALLTACQDRPMLWLYVLVLGETGVRCDSEALWLRWKDIDLKEGFVHVDGSRKGRRTKSGKSRWVPLTRRLRDALQDHMARYRMKTYHGKPTPWVFHHVVDRRRAKAGERIQTLRRGFEAAVSRAKLPADLNQHDLRHRRVTTWLEEGQPIYLVQDAMGHSTVKVTEGYKHLTRKPLRGLVERPTREELKEMVR